MKDIKILGQDFLIKYDDIEKLLNSMRGSPVPYRTSPPLPFTERPT